MAGPWEAYQDISGAQLARNDQTVTAPARAPVPSTNRVWGDAEAQQAGLYESPQKSGPWDAFKPKAPLAMPADRAPTRITVNPVSSRFADIPQIGGDQLQQGLNQRGLELTRGPEVSPSAQMAGEAANLLPAATQGTSPHVSDYGGQVVSTEVHEDDAGNILYRDPQTGQFKPTNNETQVAIRDPADGVVKVFNRTEATNEGPALGVSRVLGPGLGAGAVTKRAMIGAAPKLAVTGADIFKSTKPYYQAFDKVASSISAPNANGEIATRLTAAMNKVGATKNVADEVHSIVAGIGENPTLAEIKSAREALGKSAESPVPRVRQAAAIAKSELTKIISETSPQAGAVLGKADAIHATGSSLDKIERLQNVAKLRAGPWGLRGNAPEKTKGFIGKILEKFAAQRRAGEFDSANASFMGFKPNELEAMKSLVEGGFFEKAARIAGEASPTKGVLRTGMEVGAVATAGPVALAIPAIGLAGNKIAQVITSRNIGRLKELIAKRSPAYAEAVANAASRWEKAQVQFVNDPSPNRLAAYISASRALSSGLTKDGIEVTSGALLKSIQSPMKSAAEGDEPAVPGRPGQ